MYRLNDKDKETLVKQIIKRLNPLYILTLNTCSSMSMSSLNSHLSLVSAIVNKDKLRLGKTEIFFLSASFQPQETKVSAILI